jgi:pyruvate dehydrogenase E2 component (dihydrolipoamide acetyltransferase)
MPIHDQSYRRYGGGKATPGWAWTVIAKAGIKQMIRKRAFLGILLLSSAAFVVRAVQLYIAANVPQAAILAVGTVAPKAVVKDGKVEVRQMMSITLSGDHRAIDGAVGAQYLKELKGLLEKPMRLLF